MDDFQQLTDAELVDLMNAGGSAEVTAEQAFSLIASQRNRLWVAALDSTHEASLTQQVFSEAQQQISEQPLEPHLVQRAKLHAQTVLQELFGAGGWDVELRL